MTLADATRSGAILLLVLSACWRGNEPAAAPPTVAQQPPVVDAPPPRVDDPAELAQVLRSDPSRVLADDGPIVVLYYDVDLVETLCGFGARDAQRAWGERFTDARRSEPVCTQVDDTIRCAQRSPSVVSVTFATTPRLRPISAVIGSAAGHGSIAAVRKHEDTLQSARCP